MGETGATVCFLDLYMGQLCSLICFNQLTKDRLIFSKSSGCSLFTWWGCSEQCGHNHFDHNDRAGPKLIMIDIGAESSQLWVANGSHKNVHMPVHTKQLMTHFMEMQIIIIPAHSIFVGNSYLQHSDASWCGT